MKAIVEVKRYDWNSGIGLVSSRQLSEQVHRVLPAVLQFKTSDQLMDCVSGFTFYKKIKPILYAGDLIEIDFIDTDNKIRITGVSLHSPENRPFGEKQLSVAENVFAANQEMVYLQAMQPSKDDGLGYSNDKYPTCFRIQQMWEDHQLTVSPRLLSEAIVAILRPYMKTQVGREAKTESSAKVIHHLSFEEMGTIIPGIEGMAKEKTEGFIQRFKESTSNTAIKPFSLMRLRNEFIILSSKKALLNPLAESGFDVLGSTVFSIKLPNQSLKESLGFVLKNISHFPHSERHQNVFKQLEAAASQPPRSAQTKMRYIR